MRRISTKGLKHGPVEAIIEVVRDDCVLDEALPNGNCSIERLAVGPKRTLHKVVCHDNEEEVKRNLASRGLKYRNAGTGAIWVEGGSCTACDFFSSSFSGVLGTRTLQHRKIQYRILLPSARELRTLEASMKSIGLDYELLAVIPYVHQELTERQREILMIAMEQGYFEDNSRTSLTKLAEIIGLSPSSLSEIMRRSLKKSVNFYFNHRP